MERYPREGREAGGVALAARIDRLERRGGRLEGLLAAAALALAAVVLMGQAPASMFPDVLAARSFRLVDGDGNARGAWTVADDGAVHLSVLDARGRSAATLELSAAEPYVIVRDAAGAPAERKAAAPALAPAAAKASGGASKSTFPVRIEKPDDADEDDGFEWLD